MERNGNVRKFKEKEGKEKKEKKRKDEWRR